MISNDNYCVQNLFSDAQSLKHLDHSRVLEIHRAFLQNPGFENHILKIHVMTGETKNPDFSMSGNPGFPEIPCTFQAFRFWHIFPYELISPPQ